MINIQGLDKAEVLAALYNNSKPLGMGMIHYDSSGMTKEEAVTILSRYKYFDYLKGRVMKIDFSSDIEFNERLYDRDNGQGAAKAVIDSLRDKI
jgi:hypothetical protein